MVAGTVLRSHAGGYLVYVDELKATLLCSARGRLKKERKSILTGDRVKLDQIKLDEVDPGRGTAVITATLDRQSLLSRPPIANVDQVVIVQAVHQPEWNPLLCDRYLVHFQLELPPKLASGLPLLCFNKCDLSTKEELEALQKIYEPLGYLIHVVSARTGQGIEELVECLSGKISVLAGQSGVGKSSLINFLDPSLNLKIGVMENEFGDGRHTTTYSEIYKIRLMEGRQKPNAELKSGWVADTPGFSPAEMKHPQPLDVAWQFPEIAELADKCKFSNCLHLVEQGCNVIANVEKIVPSRYESFTSMVKEAQEEESLRQGSSQKSDASVKYVGGKGGRGKLVPRLNNRYRTASRRSEKQQLLDDELEDDEEAAEETEES